MLKAEAGAKNKWRWEWQEETSVEGIAISTWCKKLDLAGTCFCIVCSRPITTADNIYNAVANVLADRDIPISNVVSCLMDNCATMRGCRSGGGNPVEESSNVLVG